MRRPTPPRPFARPSTRGATIVEYALLIIAVMFIAALSFRLLGRTVRKNADKATEQLMMR